MTWREVIFFSNTRVLSTSHRVCCSNLSYIPRRPLNGHWNRVRSRLFPSISYLCLSIHSIYLYLSKMLPNWRRIDKGLKSAFLIPYFSWPGILVQTKSPWTDNSPKICCLYSFRPFANTSDKFPSSTEVCWYFLKNPVSRLYSILILLYTVD